MPWLFFTFNTVNNYIMYECLYLINERYYYISIRLLPVLNVICYTKLYNLNLQNTHYGFDTTLLMHRCNIQYSLFNIFYTVLFIRWGCRGIISYCQFITFETIQFINKFKLTVLYSLFTHWCVKLSCYGMLILKGTENHLLMYYMIQYANIYQQGFSITFFVFKAFAIFSLSIRHAIQLACYCKYWIKVEGLEINITLSSMV